MTHCPANRPARADQETATTAPAGTTGSGLIGPCRNCAVRGQSVCSALGDLEMTSLSSIVVQTRYEDGATIIMEGDPAEHLFNLLRGTVKIYRLMPDGRRQITGFLMPGDFLGLALADQNPYTAEAVGEVLLCRFPRPRFEGVLARFPHFQRRLLQNVSNELYAAQDQMLLLGRKTAREKVASFLLRLASRPHPCGDAPSELNLAMSRTDIADYLGLTIETVSRTMTQLRRDGIIELHGANAIEIRDLDALEDAAGGDAEG